MMLVPVVRLHPRPLSWGPRDTLPTPQSRSEPNSTCWVGCRLCRCRLDSVVTPTNSNCDFMTHLSFFYFTLLFCYIFQLFIFPFRFSLCQRIWIASICMPYMSYPVRRHVFPLSTMLTTLVCSISVSWFCDHRACISLGGRIGTDTGTLGVLDVDG